MNILYYKCFIFEYDTEPRLTLITYHNQIKAYMDSANLYFGESDTKLFSIYYKHAKHKGWIE